jgi:hypothetical protein
MPLPPPSAVNALPVPGQSVFEFSDRPRLAARAVTVGHANHHAAQPGRQAPKRLVQVRKGSV